MFPVICGAARKSFRTMKPLFSEREVRAVAIFLPLAGLVILGLLLARPRTTQQDADLLEREFEERVDSAPTGPTTTSCAASGSQSTRR